MSTTTTLRKRVSHTTTTVTQTGGRRAIRPLRHYPGRALVVSARSAAGQRPSQQRRKRLTALLNRFSQSFLALQL
jgi:hypothetical protein